MSSFEELAKRYHRQPVLRAAKDVSQLPRPESVQQHAGAGVDCGDPDLIPTTDEWSDEARKKAAETRKKNSTEQSHLKREKKSAEAEAHRFSSTREGRSDLAELLAYEARHKRRGY